MRDKCGITFLLNWQKLLNAKHVFNSSPKHESALFCLPSSFQRSVVISFLSRQRLSFLFHFDLLQSRLKSRTPSPPPAILQLQRGERWWMARTETDWDFGTRRRNWNLPDYSFPMEKRRGGLCCRRQMLFRLRREARNLNPSQLYRREIAGSRETTTSHRIYEEIKIFWFFLFSIFR